MELEVHWAGEDGQRIGHLFQDERGAVFFEYDPQWRSGRRELSPLYLPNETAGAVLTPTPGFGQLHGLFQDALPDWWGERLMRRHFEDRGIPWKKVTALRKLACQGDRKMGALAFRPEMAGTDFNTELLVELGELVEAAREALRGESGAVLAELLSSGMSPGGAQPKALLAIAEDFSEIRLDDPAPAGFGCWLIKFDTEPVLHEGGIEAAYSDMARAAGRPGVAPLGSGRRPPFPDPPLRPYHAGAAASAFLLRPDPHAATGRTRILRVDGSRPRPHGRSPGSGGNFPPCGIQRRSRQ